MGRRAGHITVIDRESATSSAASLAAVDDALRVVSTREAFTRAEAMGVLHRVEAWAHDLPAGARVAAIVRAADSSSSGQLVVSRSAVVDPLLDIRLVLSC